MHSRSAVAQLRSSAAGIAALSCGDFERLIGETFRRRGFHVAGFGADAFGAADLALLKSGERFLVHCRHWRKQEIGVLAVRELSAALKAVGAQGGYVLTSGGFAREACEFVRNTSIELIGGAGLTAWLRGSGRGERRARAAPNASLAVAKIA